MYLALTFDVVDLKGGIVVVDLVSIRFATMTANRQQKFEAKLMKLSLENRLGINLRLRLDDFRCRILARQAWRSCLEQSKASYLV